MENILNFAKNINKPVFFIDIEATNSSPNKIDFEMIEIGWVEYHPNGIIKEFNYLLNCKKEIPPEIVKLTGITKKMVESGCNFKDISCDLFNVCKNGVLSGFGVHGFDALAVFSQLKKHELILDGITSFDVRNLWMDYSKSHLGKLKDVAINFGYNDFNAHRALEDAKASAFIFNKLLDFFSHDYCQSTFRNNWSPSNFSDSKERMEKIKALEISSLIDFVKSKSINLNSIKEIFELGWEISFNDDNLIWKNKNNNFIIDEKIIDLNPVLKKNELPKKIKNLLQIKNQRDRAEILLKEKNHNIESIAKSGLVTSFNAIISAQAKLIREGVFPPWQGLSKDEIVTYQSKILNKSLINDERELASFLKITPSDTKAYIAAASILKNKI